jgi:hypothetical protein
VARFLTPARPLGPVMVVAVVTVFGVLTGASPALGTPKRLREAGMALEAVQAQAGHRSIESTRVYLHLANDWLADQYLRASELIDADTAAVGQMLAIQETAVS